MRVIDPKDISNRENYKLLIGSIIPRPIAFVTSMSGGIVNGAPFSYFNIVSSTPPLISISILREGDFKKDTLQNILENKEFVVHLVNSETVEKINETSKKLPSNKSEIDDVGLTYVKSKNIDVPGIRESKFRLECILEKRVELFQDEQAVADLIIGRVVCYHVAEEILFDGKIDPIKLDPISRLAGNSYSKLGTIFELKRPK